MLRIVCDTREQRPLRFSNEVEVIHQALTVGDYSIQGLEDQVIIERKSLSDLLASITSGRERFTRELRQLRAFRFAALVVESDWPTIMTGMWPCPSAVHPNAALGSLMSFTVKYGVQVVMADDHQTAAALVERLLSLYAKMVERDAAALSSVRTPAAVPQTESKTLEVAG